MVKTLSRDALHGSPRGEVAIAPTQRVPHAWRVLPTRFATPALSCERSNDTNHAEETATRHDSRQHNDVQERTDESPRRSSVRGDPSAQAAVSEAALEPRYDVDKNPHSISFITNSVDEYQDVVAMREEQLEPELLDDEIQDNAPCQRAPIQPETAVGVQGADVSTADQEKGMADDVDTVDATNDELFMRIVLERASFECFAPRRSLALDAIVHAFVAAGGVGVRDRPGVTKRLSILTLLLYERPHLLTPALCKMVLIFNELNYKASYAGRLGGAFQATLRTHASTRVVASSGIARLHPKNNDHLRKRAVVDELLMRLVVYYRVFETSLKDRPDAWMKISEVLNATIEGSQRPSVLTDGKAAVLRVRYAKIALLDPTHRYHVYLTPTLRAMLTESHIFESNGWCRARSPEDDELFAWIVLAKRPFDSSGDAETKIWKDIDNAFLRCSENTKPAYSGAKSYMVNLVKNMVEHPQHLAPVVHTLISEYLFQVAGKSCWEHNMLNMLGTSPSTEDTPCLESATGNDRGDGNEIVRVTRERGGSSTEVPTAHVLPSSFILVSAGVDADQPHGGATTTNSLIGPTRQHEKILEDFHSTEATSRSSSAERRKRTASSTASTTSHELGAKRRRVLLWNPDGEDEDAIDEAMTDIGSEVALSLLRRDTWNSGAINVNARVSNRGIMFKRGRNLQSHIDAMLDHVRTDPEPIPPRLQDQAAQRQINPAYQAAHTPSQAPNVATSTDVQPQPREQDQVGPLHGQSDIEAAVTKLCESLTRLTEKVDAQLASISAKESILTKTIETQQTHTTELLKAFEVERREFRALLHAERDAHRREIQALVQTERKSHRHKSQVMLDTINRLQQDRLDDFMMMANLISRSFPPACYAELLEETDVDSEPRE